jgi:hypothetical protein
MSESSTPKESVESLSPCHQIDYRVHDKQSGKLLAIFFSQPMARDYMVFLLPKETTIHAHSLQ